jgi:hypothetical protein
MRLEGLASVLFKDDIKTMTALRLTRSFLIAIFLPLAVAAIQ